MELKYKILNFKSIICILGIVLGIVVIIIGLTNIDFNNSYQGYVAREEYGGAAYTGIQNAAAQVTTNTYNMYQTIQTFSRVFFVISGVLIILHYALMLYDSIKFYKSKEDLKWKKTVHYYYF